MENKMILAKLSNIRKIKTSDQELLEFDIICPVCNKKYYIVLNLKYFDIEHFSCNDGCGELYLPQLSAIIKLIDTNLEVSNGN